MHVEWVHIQRWRNLQDVTIEPLPGARLVCLVGENGTGKSGILELIVDAFERVGVQVLSVARTVPRILQLGDIRAEVVINVDPLDEAFFTAVKNNLAESRVLTFEERPAFLAAVDSWDRTFTVAYEGNQSPRIAPRGVSDPRYAARLGGIWTEFRRSPSRSMNWHPGSASCLSLGPDRVYQGSSLAQGRSPEQSGRQLAPPAWESTAVKWVAEQVLPYRLEEEQWLREARRKVRSGDADLPPFPRPPDVPYPFPGFKEVLPHLGPPSLGRFSRDDQEFDDIVFEGPAEGIPFSDLSSGEKDVIITATYVEAFAEAPKVLLIDEPELHLHPDMTTRRMRHLVDRIGDGQVWIATHSLEAALEARDHVFVLRRDPDDGLVKQAVRRGDKPAFAMLADSVGMPSFALARRRFVIVEDAIRIDKINRFEQLFGTPGIDKFLPVYAYGNVAPTLRWLGRAIAGDSYEQLKVCGIVDRDLRTDQQVQELESSDVPIHVLACHEIENIFLQPALLDYLKVHGPRPDVDPEAIVQEAADRDAGSWIAQRARYLDVGLPWDDVFPNKRDRNWVPLDRFVESSMTLAVVLGAAQFGEEQDRRIETALQAALEQYNVIRLNRDELAVQCRGKEILTDLLEPFSERSVDSLIGRSLAAWRQVGNPVPWPTAVLKARDYLNKLEFWSPGEGLLPEEPLPRPVKARNTTETSSSPT